MQFKPLFVALVVTGVIRPDAYLFGAATRAQAAVSQKKRQILRAA